MCKNLLLFIYKHDENTLFDILRDHENMSTTTYFLLNMKSLCESLIGYKCLEIQFFESQLERLESALT